MVRLILNKILKLFTAYNDVLRVLIFKIIGLARIRIGVTWGGGSLAPRPPSVISQVKLMRIRFEFETSVL